MLHRKKRLFGCLLLQGFLSSLLEGTAICTLLFLPLLELAPELTILAQNGIFCIQIFADIYLNGSSCTNYQYERIDQERCLRTKFGFRVVGLIFQLLSSIVLLIVLIIFGIKNGKSYVYYFSVATLFIGVFLLSLIWTKKSQKCQQLSCLENQNLDSKISARYKSGKFNSLIPCGFVIMFIRHRFGELLFSHALLSTCFICDLSFCSWD